jgi:hypothetical protein
MPTALLASFVPVLLGLGTRLQPLWRRNGPQTRHAAGGRPQRRRHRRSHAPRPPKPEQNVFFRPVRVDCAPFPILSCPYQSFLYLDVIHIAIVYGERDLLELRIGSISPLDLNDLIASVLYSRGNTTA